MSLILIYPLHKIISAALLATVTASYHESHHAETTYHETQKPIEIPIIKKYAIPIPHPIPVPIPQQIKVPIPQPYQVQVPVPHPGITYFSQSFI